MRALLLLSLLLAAPAAHADAITAVAFLAEFIGGAAAAFVVAGAAKIVMVGLYVYGTARARRDRRKARARARSEAIAQLQDRSITGLNGLPPWRIVVGRCITGGEVHAIFTSDKTSYREDGSTSFSRPDALKHVVIVFADHECAALHEIFIDGVALGALDGSGNVTTGEFFTARVDSRTATIGGGGSVTVAEAVVTLLHGYTQTGNGDAQDITDVTASLSLSGGNLTINGPAGAIVNYTVQANLVSVRVQKHLGTASQTVDTYLTSVAPSQWVSTDRLLNKCYIVLTLDLENQRFIAGIPNVTADISGRKVYDPRKDSTVSGGSGSHRAATPSTWEWSDNAALGSRDYLQAEWGCRAEQEDINDAYTITAANASDARESASAHSHAQTFTASASTDEITFAADEPYGTGDGVRVSSTTTLPGGLSAATTYYVIRGSIDSSRKFKLATSVANAYAGTAINITSAGSGTHTCTWHDYARYKANGVIVTNDDWREPTLDALGEAMAGSAVYGAQWELLAGAWTSPVMDLTDDDLQGDIEIVQGDLPLDQLLNGVRCTYVPIGKSVAREADSYSNATYVSADGDEHWDDLPLDFVDNQVRARNLCRIRVESQRNGLIIRYPAKLRAWPLQRGDRVRVTNTEHGYTTAKVWRITDWQFGVTSPVLLTLQEDDAGAWDISDATTIDSTPNTALASPNTVQSLGTLTCTSGVATLLLNADGSRVPRVKVSWAAVTDPYLADGGGRVIIKWRTPRGSEWQQMEVLSDETAAFISGVREGELLVIEAAARNSAQRLGPPSFASHQVAYTQYPGGSAPRGNLIDARAWVIGTSGDQGVAGGGLFTAEITSGENAIVFGDSPETGVSRPKWRGTSGDSASSDRDGGFKTGEVPIDRTKAYRWSVWIKARTQVASAGTFYFGPSGSAQGDTDCVRDIATGSTDTNPYFLISQLRADLAPTRWYLLVGYVLPHNFGTTPPSPAVGGIYDGLTGLRIADADEDYKWTSTATVALLRVFQYNSNTGNVTDFLAPRLEMCDGTEPTVDQLLAPAKTNAAAPDFEGQFALNGQFSNWLKGATEPVGWLNIDGTPSKETTITRTGPNAMRLVSAGGASTYNYRTLDFALPLAAGSFVEGTLDVYLDSHSSGGYPGLMVRCYTDSGLTTQRDNLFDLPNTTADEWQTIPFKATVQDGERIYGVRFYCMASYSLLSGGQGVNNVVFDSLVAKAVQPSGTGHVDAPVLGESRVATDSSTTVTEVAHVPDGFAFNTIVVADSGFTAAGPGKATCTFSGDASKGASSDALVFSIQDANGTYGGDVQEVAVPGIKVNVGCSRQFTLVAGDTYEFGVYASKGSGSGSPMVVTSSTLVIEIRYTRA